MKPILKKLRARFAEKLEIIELDIDEAPGIARAFNVMSIPELALVSGKTTLVSLVGAHSFAELVRRLEPLIEKKK
jgi:thioredoxin 1